MADHEIAFLQNTDPADEQPEPEILPTTESVLGDVVMVVMDINRRLTDIEAFLYERFFAPAEEKSEKPKLHVVGDGE